MSLSQLNGVWSVGFSGNELKFSGILVLNDGKATGGDSSYVYSGHYTCENAKFGAKIIVKKYNEYLKTMMPDNYVVSMQGKYTKNELTLHGSPDDMQELKITVAAKKQANLPT